MKINFISLGCDKNLVDSEIMLGILIRDGHEITYNIDEADVVVINTCGFIKDANTESIDVILEAASNKVKGKLKSVIVTGCMATRYSEEILNEIPEVDAVVGVNDYEGISKAIEESIGGNDSVNNILESKNVYLSGSNTQDEELYKGRVLSTPGHFAYIKISEGCDNCCTYCTIPSIRGKYSSRSLNGIIEEAKVLAKSGVKELILVGQDTSLYGTDIYGENKLHVLLKELSEIESILWIRILYCYPEHLTENTINEMASNEKICNYIDMPIQHIDDKILKLMARKSSGVQLREIIAKLRNKMPDIAIRTTLIVGFPGETEIEFDNLLRFVEEMKFDRLGVFEYSKEEGTPSAKFAYQVVAKVKKERYKKIMELQQKVSLEKNMKFLGKNLDVIVDGYIPEDKVYCGRSYRDSYDIDGMVFFKSDENLNTGDFIKVFINDYSEYDLKGDALNEPGK